MLWGVWRRTGFWGVCHWRLRMEDVLGRCFIADSRFTAEVVVRGGARVAYAEGRGWRTRRDAGDSGVLLRRTSEIVSRYYFVESESRIVENTASQHREVCVGLQQYVPSTTVERFAELISVSNTGKFTDRREGTHPLCAWWMECLANVSLCSTVCLRDQFYWVVASVRGLRPIKLGCAYYKLESDAEQVVSRLRKNESVPMMWGNIGFPWEQEDLFDDRRCRRVSMSSLCRTVRRTISRRASKTNPREVRPIVRIAIVCPKKSRPIRPECGRSMTHRLSPTM